MVKLKSVKYKGWLFSFIKTNKIKGIASKGKIKLDPVSVKTKIEAIDRLKFRIYRYEYLKKPTLKVGFLIGKEKMIWDSEIRHKKGALSYAKLKYPNGTKFKIK